MVGATKRLLHLKSAGQATRRSVDEKHRLELKRIIMNVNNNECKDLSLFPRLSSTTTQNVEILRFS